VAHSCNPSYLRGKDRRTVVRDQPAWTKSQQDPISTNKPAVVAHALSSSYAGGRDRRIMVQGQPGQKHETLFEK
jgi:hypothetical protein